MGMYQRSTRECAAIQLKPELLRAAREYFNTHGLGDVETEVLHCCETVSEKKAGNWLTAWLDAGADGTIHTGILLTREHLVWVRAGDLSGVHAVGADLKYIRANMHVSLFSKDTGLEIIGLLEGAKSIVRGVIGLGPEPASQQFCDAVHQAVEKINPGSVRKWPAWMGGPQ